MQLLMRDLYQFTSDGERVLRDILPDFIHLDTESTPHIGKTLIIDSLPHIESPRAKLQLSSLYGHFGYQTPMVVYDELRQQKTTMQKCVDDMYDMVMNLITFDSSNRNKIVFPRQMNKIPDVSKIINYPELISEFNDRRYKLYQIKGAGEWARENRIVLKKSIEESRKEFKRSRLIR